MQASEAVNDSRSERDKPKRTHHRSPSYPTLSLEQAIEKARVIYNAAKRSSTSRAAIVKSMGYKDESSGQGNRELAALKQYGLLEEKSGEFRVSDSAYSIMFLSEDSEERRSKTREAALAPAVFREMFSRYGSDTSNELLSDYLINAKKFNPASVPEVIANYRATILFGKVSAVTYNGEQDSEVNEDMLDTQTQPPGQILPPPPLGKTPAPKSAPLLYSWGLSETVIAKVEINGPAEVEDLEALQDYVGILIKSWKRKSQKATYAGPSDIGEDAKS